MPNKRNKNRDKIAVTLSADKRDEINEYLAAQHSIKDTVELALLLAKKTFGLRDLEAAYQDYALSLTPGPFLNGQNLSSTVPVAASPERDAQSDKKVAQKSGVKEKLANKDRSKESLAKKKAVKPPKKKTLQHKHSEKTSKASKKLDPKAINQLFDSGNLSDL